MVIEYVGRTTTYKGKPLWEILGNLKNCGVGRMVTRTALGRFPEPSYFRILKVSAQPDVNNDFANPRKVTVIVDKVFRGEKFPEPLPLERITYKADFILVPKDKEQWYIDNTHREVKEKLLPEYMDLPPLLQEFIMRTTAGGKTCVAGSELKCKVKIQDQGTSRKHYRIAQPDETPTVKITYDIGEPATPSLYETIRKEKIGELKIVD